MFLENEYVQLVLLLGTSWGIMCEIIRASKCRFNSVGHFMFSDVKLCGQDIVFDIHVNCTEHEPLLHSHRRVDDVA